MQADTAIDTSSWSMLRQSCQQHSVDARPLDLFSLSYVSSPASRWSAFFSFAISTFSRRTTRRMLPREGSFVPSGAGPDCRVLAIVHTCYTFPAPGVLWVCFVCIRIPTLQNIIAEYTETLVSRNCPFRLLVATRDHSVLVTAKPSGVDVDGAADMIVIIGRRDAP